MYWLFCRSWSLTKTFFFFLFFFSFFSFSSLGNLWLSFGRPGNLHPYFESKLVERELWSQASGDEHIALGTVQAGWRMCFMSVARGACWCLHEIRWTSALSLAGLDKHSPWHRNSPQMTTTDQMQMSWRNAVPKVGKGRELGSVYPSNLVFQLVAPSRMPDPPNCIVYDETVTSSTSPSSSPYFLS